ncbi:MAG: hypothetical protein ACK56F_07115 [bacterium]
MSHLTSLTSLSLSHLTSLTAQLRKITRFYKISQKERQRERESSRIKNQLTQREREYLHETFTCVPKNQTHGTAYNVQNTAVSFSSKKKRDSETPNNQEVADVPYSVS